LTVCDILFCNHYISWDHRDRMIVGFTTTYAISTFPGAAVIV
jgi:hypothetical protein